MVNIGWEHGTASGYSNHGCRCQPCRDAWAIATWKRRHPNRSLEQSCRPVAKNCYPPVESMRAEHRRRCLECTLAWERFLFAIFEKQKNACAICKTPLEWRTISHPSSRRKLHVHVDHDHKTGRVRGILCGNCNNGLGNFRDSVEFLTEAQEYLKNYGQSIERRRRVLNEINRCGIVTSQAHIQSFRPSGSARCAPGWGVIERVAAQWISLLVQDFITKDG
jgi:hypothetical protein